MKKKILIIFFFLLTPLAVLAANSSLPKIDNPFDILQVPIPGMQRFSDAVVSKSGSGFTIATTWIGEYIIGLYNYAIGIIGIIAVLGIAIGGVMWIMSAGNAGRAKEAKSWITSSLLGLTLALSSYLILATISQDFVKFNPISVLYVDPEPQFTSGGGESTRGYGTGATFTQNKSQYDEILKEMAQKYGVDCTLAKAIMLAESNANPNAVSSEGAQGLMQVMPGVATGLNIPGDPYDPRISIERGIKYIHLASNTCCNGAYQNKACTCSDVKYIIAAYNGGRGANKESNSCPGQTLWECQANHAFRPCKGNPNIDCSYRQTFNYVSRVLANYQKLQQNGWGC